MGAMQRRKGANGELEAGHEIEAMFAEHGETAVAKRTAPLQAGELQGLLPEAIASADITVDLLPDDHLEIKRAEKIEMDKWSKQAETDARGGRRPIVVYRRNNQPWRVAMRLRDYIALRARLVQMERVVDAAGRILQATGADEADAQAALSKALGRLD